MFSRNNPPPAEAEAESSYSTPLPPTLPVVKETVDSLVALAVKQRMFIGHHADRVKLELMKERADPDVAKGSWYLNGFAFSDEDAVDFVRQCPDSLSNLSYVSYKDASGLWARITSWLRFGQKSGESDGLSVADDLAFVLTVAETIEVAGHMLATVSYAMSEQTPKVGKPLRRELAFELTTSAHRGRTHSMYLMVSVTHAAQRVGAGRSANTLKLDTALYIYKPLMLGGLSGVAVNVSGTKVDDLPTADVDQFELRSILAKKGTFVASAVSDFVLDPSLDVSSDRAATVTSAACDKLTSAANAALVSFFDDESSALEAGREARRRERALREAEEREEQRLARLRAIEEERFQREMEPRPMRMPEEATSRWGAPPPLRGPPPPPRSQSVRGATERRPLRRGGQTYY